MSDRETRANRPRQNQSQQQPQSERAGASREGRKKEYELMLELDELESLLEEMEERSFQTVDDIRKRIDSINAQLNAMNNT